jgi:hypothetical protein
MSSTRAFVASISSRGVISISTPIAPAPNFQPPRIERPSGLLQVDALIHRADEYDVTSFRLGSAQHGFSDSGQLVAERVGEICWCADVGRKVPMMSNCV